LTNAAVSLLVANSVSQNVAGVSLWDFFTAGSSMNAMYQSGWDNDGNAHNQKVTLRELFAGSQVGSTTSLSDAVTNNFKANWLPLTIAVIGIPAIAKVATKVLRKPVLTPANRMLKATGLDVKI
jgi:hypothetical protein